MVDTVEVTMQSLGPHLVLSGIGRLDNTKLMLCEYVHFGSSMRAWHERTCGVHVRPVIGVSQSIILSLTAVQRITTHTDRKQEYFYLHLCSGVACAR